MQGAFRILTGITGGIAAYKVPHLIRLLRKRGADVKVVITPCARGFVGEEVLRTLTGHPLYSDSASVYDMDHIRLSEWADLFLICPATANTVAKIAAGIGDNLLTTLALSIPESKIMLAPAMNTVMWNNQATGNNIETLKSRGISVLPVSSGELACGDSGEGRMIEPEEIAEYAFSFLSGTALLKGKKVLISSGPTEEPIDPVRVITNRSSGKMGAALARQALLMGAEVTVVSGPACHSLPSGARVINVTTAEQMQAELTRYFKDTDICIMAAAVSDFRPVNFSGDKIQRSGDGKLLLELEANPDILAGLGKEKGNRFLAGFSLESSAGPERAIRKMEKKGCDMIIYNRVESSLGLSTSSVTILCRDGYREELPVLSKDEIARAIFQRTAERLLKR
ncbi:MAG: bifunctional phosphopantothenoylcysteine decarboxylase/phosphopantothenate--cysteine ligase CoaBC [Fibrobacter sp.]|jgi:phosphopantothenoylcysteine decarboxylase/phosphopantothenate--cysteine ligase|nr:bifunctional phosphopantothenoylcysteine decarboxylase/phosphopantothenate--cysteine ligase CoaBC [Fibrobacter sp.]